MQPELKLKVVTFGKVSMSSPCKRGAVKQELRTKQDSIICREDKTSSRRTNNIEVLSEQLGSLQITEEASSKYEQTDTEMLTAPAPAAVEISENVQAEMPKNMVPDPGWFDSDQTKFEDWWRGIRLFLKSNRVMETDDRITVLTSEEV